jgi:hypothetical protein
MEKHRVQTLREAYASLDQNVDEYLRSYFPPGKCRGNCESANVLKLHLLDQLRRQNIWAPGFYGPHSLADIRDRLKTAVFTDNETLTICCSKCMVGSMRTTRDVVRQITSDMARHLDELETKITFDPSEKCGMIVGFKALVE